MEVSDSDRAQMYLRSHSQRVEYFSVGASRTEPHKSFFGCVRAQDRIYRFVSARLQPDLQCVQTFFFVFPVKSIVCFLHSVLSLCPKNARHPSNVLHWMGPRTFSFVLSCQGAVKLFLDWLIAPPHVWLCTRTVAGCAVYILVPRACMFMPNTQFSSLQALIVLCSLGVFFFSEVATQQVTLVRHGRPAWACGYQ